MSTDNVFDLTVADLWDGLPDGVQWADLSEALMFPRPQREFLAIQWSAGPYRLFGDGGNLQSALRLPVDAKKVGWPLSVQPKAVSKLILSSGIMYNVVPTEWLLS
jgi:hypothetical protein